MLFSFGAFLGFFDQSTVGFRKLSAFGVGVFGGLLFEWIALPGAWILFRLAGCWEKVLQQVPSPIVNLIYNT